MKIARRRVGAVLIALTLSSGVPRAAPAQSLGSLTEGVGYVAAGASGIATGELDDRLAARGYPSFGRMALALSVGGYVVREGGVMLGAEFHGLAFSQEAHRGRAVGLGGGYGTLGVGYAVELSPRVRVYPRVGVGGGGFGIGIESAGGPVGYYESVGFDEVLADPDRHTTTPERQAVLSRRGIVVDLGAGAELLPRGRGLGTRIGLRLGYLAMPFITGWRLDQGPGESPAGGGPAAAISGAYVRVVVGLGQRR